MRCRFCFAGFKDIRTILPEGHLTRQEALIVVTLLADAGFQKITFAGGEPLLCPWLPDLVRTAKTEGMTTSIVTNASLLTDEILLQLRPHLDWLALSIDSLNQRTLETIGRTTAGRALPADRYIDRCHQIVAAGIRLKVNTVVTRANWLEDLSEFIVLVRPLRWKIMQALPIHDQNSGAIDALLVTPAQFYSFIDRHRHVGAHGVTLVPESNDDMTGSYAMIDPAGRFYDNVNGTYTYSGPILVLGVHRAIAEVRINAQKFLARGGRYDWNPRPDLAVTT